MARIVQKLGFHTLRLLQVVFRLPANETANVPITRSPWNILTRCLIHIVPAAVGLYLITINLSGRYIGEHLGNGDSIKNNDGVILAFIQVAAKIQVRMLRALSGNQVNTVATRSFL